MADLDVLKKRKSLILIGACALVVLLAFASGGTWLLYHKPAYEGRVIDYDTKEPIEGAVVVAIYNAEAFGGIQTLSDTVGYAEALTDKNGKFLIPDYYNVTGPLSWSRDTTFIVYKPEYQSVENKNIERCFTVGCKSWEAGSHKNPSGLVAFSTGVIELKKIIDKEARLWGIPSRPTDAEVFDLPKLYKVINEERASLGYSEFK